jgi:hypothetical protein
MHFFAAAAKTEPCLFRFRNKPDKPNLSERGNSHNGVLALRQAGKSRYMCKITSARLETMITFSRVS